MRDVTCLIMLCLLAPVVIGRPLSGQQQAAPRDRATADSLGQTQRNFTNSFLPYQVGNRWDYQACEIPEYENDGNSRPKPCYSFSESVIWAATVGRSAIVTEFRRRGFTSKYSSCIFEDGKTRQVYWYLTTRVGVFLACSPEQKAFFEGTLKELDEHPDHNLLLSDPDFLLPFKLGAERWDGWTVTAKSSKTVAAGAFDDCYELTKNIPVRGPKIELKEWVCKGIGVVAYDYPGDVAGSRYRIELVDCMISGGPACTHRPKQTFPK